MIQVILQPGIGFHRVRADGKHVAQIWGTARVNKVYLPQPFQVVIGCENANGCDAFIHCDEVIYEESEKERT